MKFPTANEIIELAEIIKWSMAGVKVFYLDNEGVEREAIVRSITRYHEDVREEMIRFTSTITGTEIFYPVADVLQWKLNCRIELVK